MNETTIMLVPSPGAKPEFLATVEPLDSPSTMTASDDLPFEIILEGYTRDAWSQSTPSDSADGLWRDVWLKSIDGRKKLPGFVKYLGERKKAAFGKFDSSEGGKAVFLVPHQQPPFDGPEQQATKEGGIVFCRYALDEKRIPGFGSKPKPSLQQQKHQQQQQQQMRQRQQQQQQQQMKLLQANKAGHGAPNKNNTGSSSSSTGGSLKSGLLGGLVGASKETNTYLNYVPSSSKQKQSGGAANGSSVDNASTSTEVIAKFRQEVEQKLLDFQSSAADTVCKVKVSLVEKTKNLSSEEKGKITMEILKYIVYEQAEEIGEDRWVAAKDDGDFMDEVVVAVYKEGHCPPEVLEELNKGDLPDEIVGQQRAMQENRAKVAAKKDAQNSEAMRHKALSQHKPGNEGGMTQLNTAKRDRRTIEEIQRDKSDPSKRPKTSQ